MKDDRQHLKSSDAFSQILIRLKLMDNDDYFLFLAVHILQTYGSTTESTIPGATNGPSQLNLLLKNFTIHKK